jgi:ankyrin repeat protein
VATGVLPAGSYKANTAEAWTLLGLSCFNGDERAVRRLLAQEGVDVNKGSKYQQHTPLHVASMQGHASIVQALIDRAAMDNKLPAAVQRKTTDKKTPLLYATVRGHAYIIRLLIDAGAKNDGDGEW